MAILHMTQFHVKFGKFQNVKNLVKLSCQFSYFAYKPKLFHVKFRKFKNVKKSSNYHEFKKCEKSRQIVMSIQQFCLWPKGFHVKFGILKNVKNHVKLSRQFSNFAYDHYNFTKKILKLEWNWISLVFQAYSMSSSSSSTVAPISSSFLSHGSVSMTSSASGK